jgi:hypothetical protein
MDNTPAQTQGKPLTALACRRCDRAIAKAQNCMISGTALVLCLTCVRRFPDELHALTAPDCTVEWHNVWDHDLQLTTRAEALLMVQPEIQPKDNPHGVEVGQVWQDKDPRGGGRRIRIRALTQERAMAEVVRPSVYLVGNGHRTTAVLLAHFSPAIRRGWELIPAERATAEQGRPWDGLGGAA